MASYIAPPWGSPASMVHGYLLEALAEGESWLKAQRPSTEWDKVLDMLAPSDPARELTGYSNTGFNNGKRITKDLVASLTNFSHEGDFRPEWDQTLYAKAQALSKRDRDWFRRSHGHARLRSVLQYAVALGTGYAHQVWDKDYWGPGRGDVRLTGLAPDQVTFVQLPQDHDLQRAYIVIIREELPINLAKRIYRKTNGAFAQALEPDRDTPNWLEKGLRKVQALLGGSPVLRLSSLDKKNQGASYPTVDIFHAYILDDSINVAGVQRELGAHGTNWSYSVPSVGTPIDTGLRDPEGRPLTRIAGEDDAALFPLRRYCIFSRSVDFPAYDGSSPWWHGKVPLARFRFNDWAWEALGQSLVGDTRTMQDGIERMMQDIEDSMHARLDPPLLYDENRTSKGFADAVDPRRPGVRAAADLNMGEIFKIVGQPWQYEVPQGTYEWIKQQEARMEKLTNTPDLVAIAKAKQVPGEGTLEKLMEMAGPLVQDMIRSVEEPLLDLGEMRKAYYLQFDSYKRILQLSGPLGDEEEFTYDPDLITPLIVGESDQIRRSRLRRSITDFHFHLTQSGVNEIHRMTTKLFYLQLMKSGFPISWWTFAKIAQIPNFGKEPMGENGQPVTTELEKWVAQQHMVRELAEEVGGGQPGQQGPGRPHSNKHAPELKLKDGGQRTTIATSR